MNMLIHLTPAENGWIIDLPKVEPGKATIPVKHVATSIPRALEIVKKAMQDDENRRVPATGADHA